VDVINLDMERELPLKKILEHFNYVPNIVLLTAMITGYNELRHQSSVIREFWSSPLIVAGGGLASTAPDAILKKLEVDVFVQNEGDEIIKHLLETYTQNESFKKIRGLKLKEKQGNIYYTGAGPPPDISVIPRPSYELFSVEQYIDFLHRSGRSFEIYSSKGCPFACGYCYKISGEKVRYRCVDNVIAEMQYIAEKYSIRRFSFEDDCFAINKQWLDEFCEKIKEMNFLFRFQASVNTLKKTALDKLLSVGLVGMSMGLESGSPLIQRELNKNIDLNKAEDSIRWCKANGVKYNATFVLGSFSENPETVEMTKNFLFRNGFKDNFQLFFLTPYPGTALYREAMRRGFINDEVDYIENKLNFLDTISINLTNYSTSDLIEWYQDIICSVRGISIDSDMSACTWKACSNG
ncbi:MAG TPA: radical SAM protein, partial [bacterium]|nr:radical SAM protein [bacterium]